MIHRPVLLHQVIECLEPRPGQTAIDATCGLGGHTLAISRQLGPTGRILAIDQDQEALRQAAQVLAAGPAQITLRLGNFRDLVTIAAEAGFARVDMILFDLGMSSWQLDLSGRGFSFKRDEPLIMSMTAEVGDLTAKTIVNQWSEPELVQLFFRLGEEPASRRIARAIVSVRAKQAITTTGQLAQIVAEAKPGRRGRIHPATQVFQALRLAVNDELPALDQGLKQAWSLLAPTGRLAVIAFHSLEARPVKHYFHDQVRFGVGELVTKRAIKPTAEEIAANPRARSATLRVIKKINN